MKSNFVADSIILIQPPRAAPVAIEISLHFLLFFLLEVYWLQT